MIMTTVLADRVIIGPEFVPRFLDLPKVLVVPTGKVVDLAPDSTWDYVEVSGTLRVSRTAHTRLAFTTMIILPGGHFDCGIDDANDPIPADVHVEIVVRDVPIDTKRDPFQWGNGLLNFGRQDRCGAPKLEWTMLTNSVDDGATMITLADDPEGWAVGDELLITDTGYAGIRRETPVFVKSLNGRTVTLSKPLDFEHDLQKDLDGKVVGWPYVANLTRNIYLHSENPLGTRGHTANVGSGMWCICYNEFNGLGRTRGETLDVTTHDLSHIGTNQIGKYTDHAHHATGFDAASNMQSKYFGNVRRGAGPNTTVAKWGLSIHGTHDSLIERDICIDFYGAGFVTEDGYEVRNTFRRNFSAYCIGNHPGKGTPEAHSTVSLDVEGVNVKAHNNPGAAGCGYWWRGVMNTFEQNVAACNALGFVPFNVFTVPWSYPSTPGGDSDTPFRPQDSLPISFADNVASSNVNVGFEIWGVGPQPLERMTSINSGGSGIWVVASDNLQPVFVDPVVVAAQHGITSGQAYNDSLTIRGSGDYARCRVVACPIGIADGGGKHVSLKNILFQNEINLDWASASFAHGDLAVSCLYDHVMHVPVPDKPKQYIRFGSPETWDGTSPLPEVGTSQWLWQIGSQHVVIDWQGTGDDYQLFEPQSLASTIAWPSGPGQNRFNCPEVGLTMGECWTKYGIAWDGEALNDADAVHLEGLVYGLARKGRTSKLGVPRAPVTFPTVREPAVLGDYAGPYVEVFLLLTGAVDGADDNPRASVDGGEPQVVWQEAERPRTRRFFSRVTSAGLHDVTTWRVTPAGDKVPGSEMTFQYLVGEATLTLVPNVVGLQPADAASKLTGAGFVVGAVSTQESDKPKGEVLSQSPAAGSRAAAGSAVALVEAVPVPPPPVAALLPPGRYRLTDDAGTFVDFVVIKP